MQGESALSALTQRAAMRRAMSGSDPARSNAGSTPAGAAFQTGGGD